MKKELGSIVKVALRDVWGVEPDFTKWLAQDEHLTALSEELGIDLEPLETEASVGDFSADILAREASSGEKVIIENQFGSTDHDHLGKILTYASGHGAKYVVWIFEEMREEHRQAIDWLNEHTTEELSFFGVKLELWEIEGSKPAPKFDVVSRPNEWAKIVKRQSVKTELTEGRLRQYAFWTQLNAYAKETGSTIKPQSPHAQSWTLISIGTTGVHIALSMNTQEKRIDCGIYIDDDKDMFRFLQDRADDIEKELGVELEWKEAKKVTRILEMTSGFEIEKEDEYQKHFDWLLERAAAFKKAFVPRIEEYKRNS